MIDWLISQTWQMTIKASFIIKTNQKKLDQRLIIIYSPKYTAHQKTTHVKQICQIEKWLQIVL